MNPKIQNFLREYSQNLLNTFIKKRTNEYFKNTFGYYELLLSHYSFVELRTERASIQCNNHIVNSLYRQICQLLNRKVLKKFPGYVRVSVPSPITPIFWDDFRSDRISGQREIYFGPFILDPSSLALLLRYIRLKNTQLTNKRIPLNIEFSDTKVCIKAISTSGQEDANMVLLYKYLPAVDSFSTCLQRLQLECNLHVRS